MPNSTFCKKIYAPIFIDNKMCIHYFFCNLGTCKALQLRSVNHGCNALASADYISSCRSAPKVQNFSYGAGEENQSTRSAETVKQNNNNDAKTTEDEKKWTTSPYKLNCAVHQHEPAEISMPIYNPLTVRGKVSGNWKPLKKTGPSKDTFGSVLTIQKKKKKVGKGRALYRLKTNLTHPYILICFFFLFFSLKNESCVQGV